MSGIDPTKKKATIVRSGSRNILKRGKSGTEIERAGTAVINKDTLAEDRENARGKQSDQYAGNQHAAARVGGPAQAPSSPGLAGSAKKNTVRKNVVRIKRSAASPQAKKSAIKLMKRG